VKCLDDFVKFSYFIGEGDNDMKITDSKHRLKELIDILGISQTEFCNRCGLNKSALSNYLNGDREPRQDKLSLIADAFRISPSWLMGYDVPLKNETPLPDGLTQDERHIIKAYRNASEEIQSAVKAVLGIKRGIESTKEGII
jgi:transcriptional regulator with XRE-family HTH domain